MLPDLLDTSASCFVVRIWGGQEEQYTLLIEWKVNLDGLRYTGQQVSHVLFSLLFSTEARPRGHQCLVLHVSRATF